MKKLFLAFAAVVAMSASAAEIGEPVASNAEQLAVTQETKVVKNSNTATQSEDDSDVSNAGINYYSFDGFENWGINADYMSLNKFGGGFAVRMNFKDHGNINVDLGINYSIKLYKGENTTIFLTPSIGPSLRMQDQLTLKEKNGKIQEEWKEKFLFDGYAQARLYLTYQRVGISAGYFAWAPEFKFGDNLAHGFVGSLFYKF